MSEHNSCSSRSLPKEKAADAIKAALAENPNNGRHMSPHAPSGVPAEHKLSPIELMALTTQKMWSPGRTLRVKFIQGGSDYVRSKVKQYALVWTQYANISLEFVDSGDAEIRVAFIDGAGSNSYVGTDALTISADEHTMNFGWFNDSTKDDEFSRTVTHEFGHVLGCRHEHQQPNADIHWNKDYVYSYYAKQGWSHADVDRNVFYKYSASETTASAFDSASIMEYPIPSGFTTDGFTVGWNRYLSSTDIDFIANAYPYSTLSTRSLETGTFNTMSIRSWQNPQSYNVGTFPLARQNTNTPSVLLGINWLDEYILRIDAQVLEVTNTGKLGVA